MELPEEVLALRNQLKGYTQKQRILKYLLDEGKPRTTKDISDACDIAVQSLYASMSKLREDKLIKDAGKKLCKAYHYEGGMRQKREKAYVLNEDRMEDIVAHINSKPRKKGRPRKVATGTKPTLHVVEYSGEVVELKNGPNNAERNRQKWFKKEDDFILENYDDYGPDWCADKLGRTRHAVMSRKSHLDGKARKYTFKQRLRILFCGKL